jgi:type II secretory pathway component GspD/PulD (secretin)
MAAALCLVGLASADGTLQGVSVDKSGPGVAVHIKGKDLARPTKLWANRGNSLLLDFSGNLSGTQTFTKVKKGGLKSIFVENQSARKKVRVYLTLNKHQEPQLTKTADGWDVSFGQPASATKVAKAETKSTTNYVAPSVPPLEPASIALARLRGEAPSTNGPRADEASPRVSLNFTNAEVVQILKALAMQTGVNIVTAPEVKGTLTVTLDNVTVKDALDMVTSVSGLRYTKVGNSYIVATPDKIEATNSALGGHKAMMMETRVVPIYSGSGREIRASVLSSMTDATTFGNFQIFLPNEGYKIEKKKESSATGDSSSTDVTVEKDPSADAKAAMAGQGDREQVSAKGLKEQYLVLVGPSGTIGDVEDRIKELDASISKAYGFDTDAGSKLVRRNYMLRSDDVHANDLVIAVSSTQPNNFLNVDMYATPAGFQNQSIVIVGRENEVEKAEALLKDLDQSGYGSVVMMYDVQHSDPRALREALVAQVKGLRVTLAPASAGNTRVYEEGKAAEQAAQMAKNGNAGGTEAKAGQTDATPEAKGGDEEKYGLNAPYSGFEKTAVPMKLVLTGTEEQLDTAKVYLAQVDVPAKQVAIELRVMEMSKEDALKIGLDWNVNTGSAAVRTINLHQGVTDASNSATVRIGGRNWGASVTATLDQIANNNNLIARPNILALDGREAEIFVGDVIRYVESIQSTQNGVTVTTGKVPVGVRLAVLPRIGTDHMTLDLRPMVSNLKGFTDISDGRGGSMGQLPQTSLRTAQSTVAIEDGDTIAIGGLIQDQDISNVSKVPFLADLPIIGRLFKRTDKSKVRREVVLFVTAKIVGAKAGTTADPRVSDIKYPAEIKSPPKP